MAEIELFHFPGACSRVTMNALEEIGLEFTDTCINARSGMQKSQAYLAINPKAKVPALRIGDAVITENAVILALLDRLHPQAGLLPHDRDPVIDSQAMTDLVWCATTLHSMVRQVRMPSNLTKGDPDPVRADGIEKLGRECAAMARRLDGQWWYGRHWSIVDVYLYWVYTTAEKGGFPLSDYPALVDHARRVRDRPSFQRALAREDAALEREAIEGV